MPIGLSRSEEPVYANLEFLDGRRGAHINISGVSGVATKTTYALFLLFSLFESGVLGAEAVNTRSLVFNVKGEDLLFLDRRNSQARRRAGAALQALGLRRGRSAASAFWRRRAVASPRATPDVTSRTSGVTAFWWTIEEFCQEGLLPFLFADAEDDRQPVHDGHPQRHGSAARRQAPSAAAA